MATTSSAPSSSRMPARAPARTRRAAQPTDTAGTAGNLPTALQPLTHGLLPGLRSGDDIETRIYNTVFESVMTQRLTPGTKLPEAALCELFGVRRATVRKVLQTLAHDHIVDLRTHRGATVAAPTPEETRSIFEARRALEATIVRLATARSTAEDWAVLRAQLAQEHQAMHHFSQPAWARLASAFHLQLAQLARNPVLQRYLMELISRCSLIVALYEPPGKAACEHDEHAQVVDLMEQGNAEAAVQVMEAHLMALEHSIELQRTQPQNTLARMLGLSG